MMMNNKKYAILTAGAVLIVALLSCGRTGPETPPDMAPPAIIATDPGITNNVGVAIDTTISVSFSEPVVPSTILFTLSDGAVPVPCTMSYSGTTAVFTPNAPLALNTLYAASVSAGVKDSAGNAMAGAYPWKFMTGQAPTTLQINAPDVTYNAAAIVTVTVSSVVGTPEGIVALSVGSQAPTLQFLNPGSGSAVFTIPGLGAGIHSLSAKYIEQGDFKGSSATGTLLVKQAATTINISAPGIIYGANGTVTVMVGSAAGTPSGNVTLRVDNGGTTTLPLTNGSATFTITRPTAGSHSLFVTYAAQGNYGYSEATGTLGVGVGATSMTLSAPEVTYNANGVVTVVVSAAAGLPTPAGDVSLIVGNRPPVIQTLNGGSTIFTISGLEAGRHALSAAYAAQGNYDASSASGTLTVNPAATTTGITAAPVTYGQDGLVTVTVSAPAPGVPIPIGQVSLKIDGGAPTIQTLNNGTATFVISRPDAGNHALTAEFAAQGNYSGSSAIGNLAVGVRATTMTITVSEVTYNADASVTVTVISASGIPTGDVSLSIDGGPATFRTLDNGSATFTLSRPDAGRHTLNAAYAAQDNFGPSSASETLTVNSAATSTGIAADPVTYGEVGSVTVTVSAQAPGVPAPVGQVSLSIDGGASTTETLSNGSATFLISGLSAGSHPLHAVFAAQGNYKYSEASGTIGVGPGATSMTLSAPTVAYGENGIVRVTVSSTSGTPTGDVSLQIDGGSAMTQTLDNGSADFTITRPATGDHTLNAAYAAQGNYEASSALGMLTVRKAAASVTLGSLSHTYDGTQKSATAETQPVEGLVVDITYDGSPTAPTNAGIYEVIGTIRDDNYVGSATDTLVIAQAASEVNLSSSTNPSLFGESVTFTASVTNSAGVPTGTVMFKDGGTTIDTVALNDGTATYITADLSAGFHTITAEYSGDTNFIGSTSSNLEQEVR